MPGLGKSSLLKNTTFFLGERGIYPDGIVFIDLIHVTTFMDLIKIIIRYLDDDEMEEVNQPANVL